MKRLVFSTLVALTAFSAAAAPERETAAPAAPGVEHKVEAAYPPVAYRFDNPQLLTQQLLWGVFHGVRLLGLTCQAQGDHAAALAYAEWMERQQSRIRAAERDLARYYYRRDSAAPEAISQALGLKPTLDVSPDLLQAACKTLPEALAQERYDLDKLYAQRRAAVQRGDPGVPKGVWKEPDEATTAQSPIENNETQPKEQP